MLRAMQPARLPDSHLGSVAQVDTPVVDMVILVFNEEGVLEPSVGPSYLALTATFRSRGGSLTSS